MIIQWSQGYIFQSTGYFNIGLIENVLVLPEEVTYGLQIEAFLVPYEQRTIAIAEDRDFTVAHEQRTYKAVKQ